MLNHHFKPKMNGSQAHTYANLRNAIINHRNLAAMSHRHSISPDKYTLVIPPLGPWTTTEQSSPFTSNSQCSLVHIQGLKVNGTFTGLCSTLTTSPFQSCQSLCKKRCVNSVTRYVFVINTKISNDFPLTVSQLMLLAFSTLAAIGFYHADNIFRFFR